MSIIKVDPETIKDNPYQPRSYYPTKMIAEIAHSIEQIGLIHIPTGRQVDGHYELAEGHLRKRAFIKLKKNNPKKFGEMPLNIRDISDKDMAIIVLEENLRRQDITPLEQARAVDMYLINFSDVTETALAKVLNMTQGNISNMRRVLKCPDEVLQKIVDGRINFTMARELLIFQGINVGFEEEYRGGKTVKTPKDEKWLMLQAVRGVGGQYGRAATVDGIKRCIYDVADSHLKHLEKETSYWGGGDRNPLFDTRAAGCLKCPKMARAFETKSRARHYCTDFECWDKKQEVHKKKQATEAKKKMEADIAKRIVAAEAHNAVVEKATGKTPKVPEMPEESTVGIPVLDTAEEVIEERGTISQEILTFPTWDEVCKGCIQQKDCDRRCRNIVSAEDGGGYACKDRVTKENYQAIREKAKVAMPDSFKEMVKDKAGTRAVVLDLRGLRLGYYRDELKAGHTLLDGHFYERGAGLYGGKSYKLLEAIDDPEECTERCTDGFHYAYDSDKMDGGVHFVCSKPKCLTAKKAAFTRAKNAAGQARKNAEMKAIRRAAEQTTDIDKPRLLLIMEAQLEGSHVSRGYGGDHIEWLFKHLRIEKEGMGKRDMILKKLPALSEDELRKLVVEFCLITLCYGGDIKGYRVQTTEKLNRMGIGIQVGKK
ncbi:Nucleoid occlusion protein [subsurface metagenome]